MMLLQAAADQWKVPVGEVTVSNGVITHAASKRTTSYGKVAAAAAKLTPPDPKDDQAQGPEELDHRRQAAEAARHRRQAQRRKVYAIDVKLPGMLNAAIKDAPVFGGKVVSFDDAKVAKMPGVKKVMKVKDTAVAVVADTWWHAKTALDALPIIWDEGDNGKVSNASIAEASRRTASPPPRTTASARTAMRSRRSRVRRRRSRRPIRRRSSRTPAWR